MGVLPILEIHFGDGSESNFKCIISSSEMRHPDVPSNRCLEMWRFTFSYKYGVVICG